MINFKEKIAEIKQHWKVHLTAFLIPFLYMLLQLYEIWINDYRNNDPLYHPIYYTVYCAVFCFLPVCGLVYFLIPQCLLNKKWNPILQWIKEFCFWSWALIPAFILSLMFLSYILYKVKGG